MVWVLFIAIRRLLHFNNYPDSVIYLALATILLLYEPRYEISNNVVCATSKGSEPLLVA